MRRNRDREELIIELKVQGIVRKVAEAMLDNKVKTGHFSSHITEYSSSLDDDGRLTVWSETLRRGNNRVWSAPVEIAKVMTTYMQE